MRLLFGVSLLSLSSLSLFRRGELTLVWRAESEKAKTNKEEKKKKKNEMTRKKSDREEERLSCLSVPLVSRLQSLVSPQTIEQTIVADSVTFLLRYFLSPQVPPTEREAHNNNKNKNKKKKTANREEREAAPASASETRLYRGTMMSSSSSLRNVLMTKTTKKRARRSTTLLFALFFFVLLGALTRVCDGAGYYAYYKRRHDDIDDKVYCYNGADHQNTGDPRDCFNTCDSCSSCDSFVYKESGKQCQFLNHNSYGKTEGNSNYEWYRPIENKLTNTDFETHVAGCLAEAPVDGLCKEYGGRGFSGSDNLNIGSMPDWDVSKVTDMETAFRDKTTFNGDLSNWDVSKVTSMNRMFYDAEDFNQDISNWNVASVTDMYRMFKTAIAFNKDISGWDVSQVETMQEMFYGASTFNQDISGWDVAKVETMEKMFYLASSFNQDVSDWSVSASATITDMFTGSAFAESRLHLEVTVSNDGATTSDEEFALGVSVSANACTGTDSSCDLSGGGTSTETDDARAEGGLYCDVSVHT